MKNVSLMIATLILSSNVAHATQLGGNSVWTCTPTTEGSALESLVITEHTIGCNQNEMPRCFAMGIAYTATVTVNVPFDNYLSQSYSISVSADPAIALGTTYEGEDFKLDMGTNSHAITHLNAKIAAKDGYPEMTLDTDVSCK